MNSNAAIEPSFRLGLLLVTVVLVAAGCRSEDKTSAQRTKPKVKVAKPLEREVIDYAYFTGRTEAEQAVDIKVRVTGYLDSVDFTPGADVKAKQQLFLIDPRPYKASLDVANGQVDLADARLVLAKADLAREQEVAKTPGAISQKDLDKYAAAESEAEAAKEAAEANAEAARLNLEFCTITSPIDGQVSRNLLTIGNLINQDQTLLTTVVSQDPMFAYFDVDEFTVLKVQRAIRDGKFKQADEPTSIPVDLGLSDEGNDYPHRGKINFIDNAFDASTGTLQVRGEFANPSLGDDKPRLLTPGLFVRIRLPISEKYQAMLVPQAAVGTDQGLKYLLVLNDQNVVEYRPVTLGPQQPGALQVVFPVPMIRTPEGLSPVIGIGDDPSESAVDPQNTLPSIAPSDRVIISGLQRVHPGQEVDPIDTPIQAGPVAPGQPPGKPKASPQPAGGAKPDSENTAPSESDAKPEAKTQENSDSQSDKNTKPDEPTKAPSGNDGDSSRPEQPSSTPPSKARFG